MMYKDLYRYFILYKELNIPGIGTFSLHTDSAHYDLPDKSMRPPSYTILLNKTGKSPSIRFIKWLAGTMQVSERDAVIRFNDFAVDLKNMIAAGNEIIWNGMGKLFEGPGGEIKFTPSSKNNTFGDAVPAEKISHENAKHSVRVGEQGKTSDEMIELLSRPEAKSSYWWAYAFIVGLLAVIFTGWYFSINGLNVSSTASRQKLIPADMQVTHKDLP